MEKLRNVVGPYLHPPEHALVLCADEKSQVQTLDRTRPDLPMRRGSAGTMTHEYQRHGAPTLFAAVELAEGRLIGACTNRRRHQEWIEFVKLIDEPAPPDLNLHVIADNYAAHKHPKVKAWLQRHPRFHMHFIPTSSSWRNLIERWFRDLTDKPIRRGVFTSVKQMIEAITDDIDARHADAKPFVWTATAEDILDKARRARAVLDKA